MSPSRTLIAFGVLLAAAFVFGVCLGCNSNDPDQRAREEKTREEVARATADAKPAIQDAGRKIGEVAHEAADRRAPPHKACAMDGTKAITARSI